MPWVNTGDGESDSPDFRGVAKCVVLNGRLSHLRTPFSAGLDALIALIRRVAPKGSYAAVALRDRSKNPRINFIPSLRLATPVFGHYRMAMCQRHQGQSATAVYPH